MMNIEKTERINNLLDIYKDLLTSKQQDVMDMYYLYDLSLSEIAQDNNITRAAVFDIIKRSTNILEEYEAKLHLLEKREKMLKIIDKLDEKTKKELEELI